MAEKREIYATYAIYASANFKGTELLLLVGDGIKTGLDPAERKKKETRA